MADEEGFVGAEQFKVRHSWLPSLVVGGGGRRTASVGGEHSCDVVAGVGGHDLGSRERPAGLLQSPVAVLDNHCGCVGRLAIPHDRRKEDG